MKKIYLTVTIDPALKAEATALAKEMGLPLSLVVSAFMREFILTRTIYFSGGVSRRSTLRALREYSYRIGELRYDDALDKARPKPWQDQIANALNTPP